MPTFQGQQTLQIKNQSALNINLHNCNPKTNPSSHLLHYMSSNRRSSRNQTDSELLNKLKLIQKESIVEIVSDCEIENRPIQFKEVSHMTYHI